MTIELRKVPREDLRKWLEAIESASTSGVSDEYWQYAENSIELDRTIGAYDGDQVVGGGAAFSFELSVPGGRAVKAAGVTNVGVSPTHRRRGILRRMMAHQLADVRSRGEPIAILWASEGSIYQRFGYGLATLAGTFDITSNRTTFRTAIPDKPGEVRLVERDEAARLLPPIYDVVRTVTPGFLSRSPDWWAKEVLVDPGFARRGHDRKFFAVHERAGKPVAYVIYRAKLEWGDVGSQSQLTIQELIAVDAAAQREMWRFVFGVDLIAHIRNRFGPPDEPLLLMIAEPRRLDLRLRDGLWLRIVDVAAALEQRGYAADGSLVLDVRDEFLPDAGGRFRLDVASGSARVTATDEPADVQLDAADLAAVYLGAFTFAQLARAGRTQETTPGGHARADALFTTSVTPWSPQIF
ncbi:MAG TPA: GNAT family N-acetyltransferase [Candidatus Limnocylindrales bacterium]|nr:GNAT family N-acetyltransferase [Candidatus Limnocylindrales bacterium]